MQPLFETPRKRYQLVFTRFGKNRFSIVLFNGDVVEARNAYNDMIQLELAKVVAESRGYTYDCTIKPNPEVGPYV